MVKLQFNQLFRAACYCIHFIHIQKGETPLLSAVNGNVWFRAGRRTTVKYFAERKKMDITQLSQVMLSESNSNQARTHPHWRNAFMITAKWVMKDPDL